MVNIFIAIVLELFVEFYYVVDYNWRFIFQEELGLKYVPSAIPMLKQASCYGNQDAAFMLSVVLNYGLVVKTHEIKVLFHFPSCTGIEETERQGNILT